MMLPDRHLQLLTAYVDGELSPQQRRHAERLLAASEEARELLRRLQKDSRDLLDLPRTEAPAGLSAAVLARVSPRLRKPRIAPPPPPVAARAFPVWAGWAAAAAVLLAVGLGTFLAHWQGRSEGGTSGVASKTGGEEDRQQPDPGQREVVKKDQPAPPDDPGPAPQEQKDQPRPEKKPLGSSPEEDEPQRPDVIFTDRGREPLGKFERVEMALPLVLKLHELGKSKDESARLREHLDKLSGVRVEMLAKNATHGFDRVKAALEARQVTLIIDPAAQGKLKAPQFAHHYAVFLENIPADDLVAILAAVGTADRLAGEKKAADGRFDGPLIVQGFTAKDQKELTNLLGIDPITVRPAPAKAADIDVRKPISDQTDRQVSDILDGKQAPRPNTAPADASAFVIPLGSRSKSAELKRFLDGRKPARAGTLQVLLVLRQQPS